MDNFEVILRQESLRRMQLVLISCVDELVIHGGWNACVVCTIERKLNRKAWIVSTLSMKREARGP